jgi:hypothetical protein
MSSTDQSLQSPPPGDKEIIPGRIWRAGLLGIVAAVVANLIFRVIVVAILPLSANFPPFQPAAVASFTLIGTALAAVVFAVVVRFSPEPIHAFRIIAAASLLISFLPNFTFMDNPSAAPFPGGSALTFGVLCLFHIIAALVCVTILTTLPRNYQ